MIIQKIAKISDALSTTDASTLEVKRLEIDEKNREVRVRGRNIHLTPTEFELLFYLYQHAGQLCKRSDIVRDVFKYEMADRRAEKSLLNTHIDRLRTKIESYTGQSGYIVTVRGHGYKLVIEPK